jgi:hypothetical protein
MANKNKYTGKVVFLEDSLSERSKLHFQQQANFDCEAMDEDIDLVNMVG